jgi:hypothetical protein
MATKSTAAQRTAFRNLLRSNEEAIIKKLLKGHTLAHPLTVPPAHPISYAVSPPVSELVSGQSMAGLELGGPYYAESGGHGDYGDYKMITVGDRFPTASVPLVPTEDMRERLNQLIFGISEFAAHDNGGPKFGEGEPVWVRNYYQHMGDIHPGVVQKVEYNAQFRTWQYLVHPANDRVSESAKRYMTGFIFEAALVEWEEGEELGFEAAPLQVVTQTPPARLYRDGQSVWVSFVGAPVEGQYQATIASARYMGAEYAGGPAWMYKVEMLGKAMEWLNAYEYMESRLATFGMADYL